MRKTTSIWKQKLFNILYILFLTIIFTGYNYLYTFYWQNNTILFPIFFSHYIFPFVINIIIIATYYYKLQRIFKQNNELQHQLKQLQDLNTLRNKWSNTLKTKTNNLHNEVENVNSAVKNISQTMTEVNNKFNDMSSESIDINIFIEKLQEYINNNKIFVYLDKYNEYASNLHCYEKKLQNLYQSISENLKKYAENLDKLNMTNAKVYNISDQTEVLSLNTIIEASRIGNHGKGLTVISDEFKKLSKNTKKNINLIVDNAKVFENLYCELNNICLKIHDSLQELTTFNSKNQENAENISNNLADFIKNSQQLANNTQKKIGGKLQNFISIKEFLTFFLLNSTKFESYIANVKTQIHEIQEILTNKT